MPCDVPPGPSCGHLDVAYWNGWLIALAWKVGASHSKGQAKSSCGVCLVWDHARSHIPFSLGPTFPTCKMQVLDQKSVAFDLLWSQPTRRKMVSITAQCMIGVQIFAYMTKALQKKKKKTLTLTTCYAFSYFQFHWRKNRNKAQSSSILFKTLLVRTRIDFAPTDGLWSTDRLISKILSDDGLVMRWLNFFLKW